MGFSHSFSQSSGAKHHAVAAALLPTYELWLGSDLPDGTVDPWPGRNGADAITLTNNTPTAADGLVLFSGDDGMQTPIDLGSAWTILLHVVPDAAGANYGRFLSSESASANGLYISASSTGVEELRVSYGGATTSVAVTKAAATGAPIGIGVSLDGDTLTVADTASDAGSAHDVSGVGAVTHQAPKLGRRAHGTFNLLTGAVAALAYKPTATDAAVMLADLEAIGA